VPKRPLGDRVDRAVAARRNDDAAVALRGARRGQRGRRQVAGSLRLVPAHAASLQARVAVEPLAQRGADGTRAPVHHQVDGGARAVELRRTRRRKGMDGRHGRDARQRTTLDLWGGREPVCRTRPRAARSGKRRAHGGLLPSYSAP